ncbi:hypothetical protein V5799_020822 [Amblyomma americanum]|uniref:Uncharacterized protein n=1 Tax=Amblyomma americanum TaxID=6943 RepID=A0AAQ4ESZ5_AMBAM
MDITDMNEGGDGDKKENSTDSKFSVTRCTRAAPSKAPPIELILSDGCLQLEAWIRGRALNQRCALSNPHVQRTKKKKDV